MDCELRRQKVIIYFGECSDERRFGSRRRNDPHRHYIIDFGGLLSGLMKLTYTSFGVNVDDTDGAGLAGVSICSIQKQAPVVR